MKKELAITVVGGTLTVALVACVFFFGVERKSASTPAAEAPPPQVTLAPLPPEASEREVRQFCGYCHAYPSPSIFPREHWHSELALAYDFWRNSGLSLDYVAFDRVLQYYQNRAPIDI